jgi:hypothetical protein
MPDPNVRIDRLEDAMGRAFNAIEALAAKEEKLDDAITLLLEAQTKTFEAQAKTEERFEETAAHLRQIDQTSRERDRALDKRVDKLVVAIGQLIERLPV